MFGALRMNLLRADQRIGYAYVSLMLFLPGNRKGLKEVLWRISAYEVQTRLFNPFSCPFRLVLKCRRTLSNMPSLSSLAEN